MILNVNDSINNSSIVGYEGTLFLQTQIVTVSYEGTTLSVKFVLKKRFTDTGFKLYDISRHEQYKLQQPTHEEIVCHQALKFYEPAMNGWDKPSTSYNVQIKAGVPDKDKNYVTKLIDAKITLVSNEVLYP